MKRNMDFTDENCRIFPAVFFILLLSNRILPSIEANAALHLCALRVSHQFISKLQAPFRPVGRFHTRTFGRKAPVKKHLSCKITYHRAGQPASYSDGKTAGLAFVAVGPIPCKSVSRILKSFCGEVLDSKDFSCCLLRFAKCLGANILGTGCWDENLKYTAMEEGLFLTQL